MPVIPALRRLRQEDHHLEARCLKKEGREGEREGGREGKKEGRRGGGKEGRREGKEEDLRG
jgi:hypothetical protein